MGLIGGEGKLALFKIFKATGQDDSKLQITSCFCEVLLCDHTKYDCSLF